MSEPSIGPIKHASTFCRVAASDGIGCRCWCLACEQHNAVDHGTLAREGAVVHTLDLDSPETVERLAEAIERADFGILGVQDVASRILAALREQR